MVKGVGGGTVGSVFRGADGNGLSIYGSLKTDDTDDQGYGVNLRHRKLEGIVFLVVGNDEHRVVVGSWLDAFDKWALGGIDDIDLVPLEEEARHGYALAGYNVTR